MLPTTTPARWTIASSPRSACARLQAAIEAYQERTGVYPSTLKQLTPRQMLSVPVPVIIPGQDWCYESTAEYYRLGYITRQHWSDPNLYARLYASSAGAPKNRGCATGSSAI